MLIPGHVSRKAVRDIGVIGDRTFVEIASTHLYHATPVMRSFLGAAFSPAASTRAFSTPLVDRIDCLLHAPCLHTQPTLPLAIPDGSFLTHIRFMHYGKTILVWVAKPTPGVPGERLLRANSILSNDARRPQRGLYVHSIRQLHHCESRSLGIPSWVKSIPTDGAMLTPPSRPVST